MIKTINGSCLLELLEASVRNLNKNRKKLNDLNVFPVPDGDTGTNMVMTLRGGISAAKEANGLSDVASKFATAAVFGARGNSGVIISQFFKGISVALEGCDEADVKKLCEALDCGVEFAYASVAKPVEGTMLTVLREAASALRSALPIEYIDEAIEKLIFEAKLSLNRTPELLPILKKAGVVDSGACGVVCIFEGMRMQLSGEVIEDHDNDDTVALQNIDLDRFDKNTQFKYGYCVEGVIQLKVDECDFVHEAFKREICSLGDSLVSSIEGDKIKLHVHTKSLGDLFNYCQRYGEFLHVKIDNMTVQQIMNEPYESSAKKNEKFLVLDGDGNSKYAIVAVASTPEMQLKFSEMGADVVILSDIAPSSKDFLDAFELIHSKEIIVFPNSSNSILSSMQAGSFYKKAKVSVLNSRSLAECFACLCVMDFDVSADEAVAIANDTMSSLYQVSVYHASKDVTFGTRRIARNEFFALANKDIVAVGDTLANATVTSIKDVLDKRDCGVITLFFGRFISAQYIEILAADLSRICKGAEIATVATYDTACDLTIVFE